MVAASAGIAFNVGPLYSANADSLADIVINQGGTDSGKTYALIQVLLGIALWEKPPMVDPIITVVGESVPNLKSGAYRIAKSIIYSTPGVLPAIRSINETERMIFFKNGWVIEFKSYVDAQSAKQGKRQYSFFNEANGIPYEIFWQIAKRTRIRTFIDFNPSEPFWAHDKLVGTSRYSNDLAADVELIISDHRHNPFLSYKDHVKTENIQDPELWKVYARGLTGNISGLVFPNWKRIRDSEFPNEDFFGGLDFGYTNDPTAGVKLAVVANSLFIQELCYEPGMSALETKQIFYAAGFNQDTEIYCEHDKDQISELRLNGLMALKARKGPGSIKGGIKHINEYDNVYYTESSINVHKERQKYMFIKDPITQRPTNIPIDMFNHLMDAIRYGTYTKFHRYKAA